MKIVYVEPKTFKCHATNDGTMIVIEKDFFENKCDAFIEGYRLVPEGETWMREDGVVFHGEMITPWKPYDELDTAQREYEKQILNEYKDSLLELGVEV